MAAIKFTPAAVRRKAMLEYLRPAPRYRIGRRSIRVGNRVDLYPERCPVTVISIERSGIVVAMPDGTQFKVQRTSLGSLRKD